MVFFGTSFTTASNDDNIAAEIGALEGVARICLVRRIPRAVPVIHGVGEKAAPAWSSHRNTGVLDLHEQGIQGEGITVAIVDTGIDYIHPSIGGDFGPGFKVVGGTDIVGDNYQGADFFPDPDPYDCGGHGTHAAGIVAGEDKNFVGVAPKSKLLAYKVFGCRADVINASIGGPGGFPEDAWATTSSRIVQQGVFVAISAGNGGDQGLFYASSGATGVDVMSVASIANEEYFAFNTEALGEDGTKKKIAYLQSGVEGVKLAGPVPVYVTSLDKLARDDACTALPEDTPDLSKYLVVRRGGCQFNVNERNLVEKNATYIWFYNTPKTPIVYPNIEEPISKGFAMIAAQDGEFIVEQFAREHIPPKQKLRR